MRKPKLTEHEKVVVELFMENAATPEERQKQGWLVYDFLTNSSEASKKRVMLAVAQSAPERIAELKEVCADYVLKKSEGASV